MAHKAKKPFNRRQIIKAACAGLGTAVAAPFLNDGRFKLFASSTDTYSAKTIDIINSSLVIDMLSSLNDLKVIKAGENGSNPYKLNKAEMDDIRTSGINVYFPSHAFIGPNSREQVLTHIGQLNGFVAEHHEDFARITDIQDFDEVYKSGRTGILYGFQNSDHFQTLDDIDLFYGLGQRVSQLTYNSRNLIGTGATDRADGGLSDYGIHVVERMDKLGMAVDVSHCGDNTTLDAFVASKKPVLITHSNCRALVPGHVRCKTDEAIQSMAKTGGVMGITGVRNFVRDKEPTTLDHFIDHIDHVVKLVGIEHVGIGTDADPYGYDALPKHYLNMLKSHYKGTYGFRDKIDIEGLDHPKKIYDLTEALLQRQYSADHVAAILGGNFKRALSDIWQPYNEKAEKLS
ncbi:MAG: dipeptidase [Kordiimonas sp.]